LGEETIGDISSCSQSSSIISLGEETSDSNGVDGITFRSSGSSISIDVPQSAFDIVPPMLSYERDTLSERDITSEAIGEEATRQTIGANTSQAKAMESIEKATTEAMSRRDPPEIGRVTDADASSPRREAAKSTKTSDPAGSLSSPKSLRGVSRFLRSKSAGPRQRNVRAESKICGACADASEEICDKCDGKHPTAKCPHFKKARSKHTDAWSSYGRSKSAPPANAKSESIIIKLSDATVVPQPGDGSCLFHSLCYGLKDGSSAQQLRKDIAAYIAKHPTLKIADTAIKEWVKYDSGGGIRAYASKMKGGTWGGGIEMAALTKMQNVNVHVYEQCKEGYRRISAFESQGARKILNVIYRGRMHYDALVLKNPLL
jgi:hypothetical protein